MTVFQPAHRNDFLHHLFVGVVWLNYIPDHEWMNGVLCVLADGTRGTLPPEPSQIIYLTPIPENVPLFSLPTMRWYDV